MRPHHAPLEFGIFLPPMHKTGVNPTLALHRDLELVTHLDRLGYAEAWIGEHHSAGSELIASPEVFIAAAAERGTSSWAPASTRCRTTTRSSSPTGSSCSTTSPAGG